MTVPSALLPAVWCAVLMVSPLALLRGHGQDKPAPLPENGRVSVTRAADTSKVSADSTLPVLDLPEFQITGRRMLQPGDFMKPAASGGPVPGSTLLGGPDLTASLSGGGKPLAEPLREVDDFSALIAAEAGTFGSVLFTGALGRAVRGSDLLLTASYGRSDGHVANAGRRGGKASLSGGTELPHDADDAGGGRMRGVVKVESESYMFYGSNTPTLERTVTVGRAGIELVEPELGDYSIDARLFYDHVAVKDELSTTQGTVEAGATVRRDLEGLSLSGDIGFWFGGYRAAGADRNPYQVEAGIRGTYALSPGLSVYGGVGLLSARGSVPNVMVRVLPTLGLTWTARSWLTVFAEFAPAVQHASLARVSASVPYLAGGPELRPEEHGTKIAVGGQLHAGSVRLGMALQYERVANYALPVDTASAGIWELQYDAGTRVLAVSADAYAQLSRSDLLALSVKVQSTKTAVASAEAPYAPRFTADILYQHNFPFRLRLEGALRGVGPRATDLANTATLRAFLAADISARYLILQGFSVTLGVSNLFGADQTLWRGYAGVPRTMALRLVYSW